MPGATPFLAQCYIQLGAGEVDLQQKYMDNVMLVEVDDSLYLPDMFTIRLRDPTLEALEADVFQPGTQVKISIRQAAEPGDNPPPPPIVVLMVGEVTAIEPTLDGGERATLVVRGYDRSHRLHRVRKTATYQQMTDSDIARRLAGGAGLTPRITPTTVVYPFLMQTNQTDWEFLMERARRIGYRLFVEDRVLHFEPLPASPPERDLEWGIHMDDFRARLRTVGQVNQVTVRGWDPSAKQAIVGQASRPSMQHQLGERRTGGQVAQAAHSIGGADLVVDQPIYTQAEADKVAQATLDKLNESYLEAEGTCGGDPAVGAATRLNITGVGPRFSGKYMVTRALHRYTPQGYSTQFWMNGGLGTGSLAELIRDGAGSPHAGREEKPTARGVMVGIVTNNSDPQNLGRVRVKFPTLGDNVEGFWCRLASSMAGSSRGIAMLPEANDEVVVAFDQGDPNFGVVLGAVWNGADPLPKPLGQLATGSTTIRRVIRTRMGHEIVFDDTSDPGGITIVDLTTNNKIEINTQQNSISVSADRDIRITSKMGKVFISGQQGVQIDSAGGKIAASGMQGVDVKSDAGKVAASGMQGVDVTGQAGKVAIQGTLGVDVTAAAAPVNVRGLPINLN